MKSRLLLGIFFAGMLALPAVFGAEKPDAGPAGERVPVRIGWQVPAATQAQIVQVLKRTNVMEIHGLEPRFVPFSFGTPQVRDALAGKLDVVFAGDQPAIDLVARGGRWKIVARLFYDRIAVMVPPNSPVRTIGDLKGKTVASPFGSSGHREAIRAQQAAGLDAAREVRNENLDALEIRRRVQAGGAESWGDIDAVAVWEPNVSDFELKGLARPLSAERTLGVIAMSGEFMAAHPEAAEQFLVAVLRAWHFFSRHADLVRQWYIDDAQLGYTPEALASAARVDPNFGAASPRDIRLELSGEHLASLERAAAWRRTQGGGGGRFRIGSAVDQSLLASAAEKVARGQFEDIQVILPSARDAPLDVAANTRYFDGVPLSLMFVLVIAIALAGVEAGHRLGSWQRRNSAQDPEGPVGTVAGAVLGLLAFVIALTFAAAGNRFDARKQALLDEVNAIGTAYLRAGLLPEPHRTTTQNLLRDYVEIRLGMYRIYHDPEKLQIVLERTAALQESIWSHAVALAEADRASQTYALFTAALNEVFDLHTKRVALGAQYRTPFFVWCALVVVSCVAMAAVGFQFGLAGKRSLAANLALNVSFALVILLILDLDRPGEGFIDVNQLPMIELYRSLGKQQ